MWDVPYSTHRYLVEPLGVEYALSMILSRYVKFIKSIKKSPKLAVQYLVEKVSRNCNTLTGRNIRYVLDKLNAEDIFKVNPDSVKTEFQFAKISEENSWRVNFVKELVNLKQKVLQLDPDTNTLSEDELEEILNYICTS